LKIFGFSNIDKAVTLRKHSYLSWIYYVSEKMHLQRSISIILLIILVFNTPIGFSQENQFRVSIQWDNIRKVEVIPGSPRYQLYFDGATYDRQFRGVPVYSGKFELPSGSQSGELLLVNTIFEDLDDEAGNIDGIELIGENISITTQPSYDQKKPYLVYQFIPIRKNPASGSYQKLISFELQFKGTDESLRSAYQSRDYASSSVLSSGNWIKFSLDETGIYRITRDQLTSFGIDVNGLDPRNIRIYGNGGGMLSEKTEVFRYDDLEENAIYVEGESDGVFDASDYILFYGESPHDWTYNKSDDHFYHSFNIYSDVTWYFITTDLGPGKRIETQSQSSQAPTNTVTKFTDFQFHEVDLVNLVNTGRIWYGEIFDVDVSKDFVFNFPNTDVGSEAFIKLYVAAKSTISSQFRVYDGNQAILTANVSGIPSGSETFARTYVGNSRFLPSGSTLTIKIDYIKSSPNALGWLNYIDINVIRNLRMSEAQMDFRNPLSAGPANISEFKVAGASGNLTVWNITDHVNAKRVSTTLNGTELSFRLPNYTLQEFIAFDGSSYLSVLDWENVPNQDLHATGNPEMIIITHESFMAQAQQVADHHRSHDEMTVLITDIKEVYNEFSSGAQDITAIRDFIKMLYERNPSGQEPDYLLLFGDASFDYKDRIENNSNFVPTWEDEESLTIVYSIATDDYYGFLDDGPDNLLDIGIGRIPVENTDQAQSAVDKIIKYAMNSPEVLGDWRNELCFVADDEDGNLHINQAEQMCKRLDTTYGIYNIDKIYVDAYPQETTPGGQRAPEVNAQINNRMQRGILFMNYTGHGGEVGWGHERFLEISDINSWSNVNMYPIFITATCEFSRYDDPERVSAGEQVFRHPSGGAVAMFTTARATFGGSNFNLNQALFDVMFETLDGEHPRFGDLIRQAKNKNGVVDNDMKFTLLGDPALMLAYPDYEIITTSINGHAVSSVADTMKALSKITVEGEIRDGERGIIESFNGTIFPKVLDKPLTITTLATDPGSYPKEFTLQKNLLYKGKAKVIDGKFDFTFIVPKDIAYNYGFGKISYYSSTTGTDASGYNDNIIIGGFDNDAPTDNTGPVVSLYMNDESFAFGGITNENPILLSYVSDENGINTVGSGIGHDIVAILDENSDKPFVLNEYYESDLDSYQSGSIRYNLSELEEGRHSLSLKVWDVHNNSSQEYTEFVVAQEATLAIEHILNYPNPFTTHTDFFFEHNQPNIPLEVQVQIFTVSGKLIKTIDAFMVSGGFRSDPISWNGTDDFGDRIGRGVYLYKVRVRNNTGEYAEQIEKLVILK